MRKVTYKRKGSLFKLIIVLGLVVVGVLVITLVKQNQDNRSKAAYDLSPGDNLRSVCKATCYATIIGFGVGYDKCTSFCDKLVFSCSNMAYLDNIRESTCFKECKALSYSLPALTLPQFYDKCAALCTGVIGLQTSVLGCNDDACKKLSGTCTAPLSATTGSRCTLANSVNGVVKADLCLSKESFSSKRCCVPNPLTPTPVPKVSCSSKGGTCVSSINACNVNMGGKSVPYTTCSGTTPVCCVAGSY